MYILSIMLYNMSMVHNAKEAATKLRKQGKSYKEIAESLNVSKSTLSYWFKKRLWSKDVTNHNTKKALLKSALHMKAMNAERSAQLKKAYRETEKEAGVLFKKYKKDPLFVAGLMLYLGEGDKTTKNNLVRVANVDFNVLQITKLFLEKYCNVKKEQIRFWVLLYPDLKKEVCENIWLDKLDLTKENLYKAQEIQGRHKTKRLIYGVGNIILGDKHLKVKILKWIELLSEDLIKEK